MQAGAFVKISNRNQLYVTLAGELQWRYPNIKP